MGQILSAATQAAIAVAILFLLSWLTGKKKLSQYSIFELACLAASGASAAILAYAGEYAKTVTAILIFTLIPFIYSVIVNKTRTQEETDAPLLLVQNGNIQKSNLKKAGINEAELVMKCKSQGVRIQDIEFAVLESGGSLHVQMPKGAEPAENSGSAAPYWGLSLNMIIDGKIVQEHLSIAERDINWILDELKSRDIYDVHQVLLAYFDAAGQFFVHTYRK